MSVLCEISVLTECNFENATVRTWRAVYNKTNIKTHLKEYVSIIQEYDTLVENNRYIWI